jgi:hypothetical protein
LIKQFHYTKSTKKHNPKRLFERSIFASAFSADTVSDSALLYLSSNNSIEKDKISLPDSVEVPNYNKFSTAHKRSACALAWNIEDLIKKHGIEKIGFLTLTFKENITDYQEAQRRFNILATNFLRKAYKGYVCVKERQKRGAWHFHLVILMQSDIKTGFDFKQVANKNYSSASIELKKAWYDLRQACQLYGFGRSELMPIKSTAQGISRYVGKYLSKHITNRKEEDKGIRLVNYGGLARMATCKFSFITEGAKLWRAKLATYALFLTQRLKVVVNMSNFKELLGKSWAYAAREIICDLKVIKYDLKDLPDFIKTGKIKHSLHLENVGLVDFDCLDNSEFNAICWNYRLLQAERYHRKKALFMLKY